METYWYTASIGGAAVATLIMERALWVALNQQGEIQERAKRTARVSWWAVVVLTALIAIFSFWAKPQLGDYFLAHGWACLFPTLAMAGLIGVPLWDRKETELLTFFASIAYACGMITSAAVGAIA